MLALGALLLLAFVAFCALGVWQLERRAWKLDLIARVDARVHAAPVPAPAKAAWPQVNAANDEYRRVSLRGRFLHDRESLVQALSDRGAGFWVLTPLVQADGTVVLVNRGFVTPALRERAARAADEPKGDVDIVGLLRLSEPGGGFLRRNDPAANRWYSRDVAAIAAARSLQSVGPVAPYFVDAGAQAGATPDQPEGGLTVIQFRNTHMSYALTWFAMALGTAFAAWWLFLGDRRKARRGEA
ncbi:SURF1 family protein [Variovorax dokdonensis]|uniref:SURF1-like protein n=1 Tax=Variovorax dokdonensis TaxID=344883 RepID=A0ABT7NDT7_9BURK|nr:SURF1 family protein [Variovorax dokdonensis]MDM0046098.1 SURF1 family protein [Variovorax dokdonensis]